MAGELQLVPLGGMGNVTQNMFMYEYEDEILLVDCGIGFPDVNMLGADILIPDISYLLKALEQGKRIVGMILTHGHDDHIGATPYILPELPEFPIYGSPLTIGFAKNRLSETKIKPELHVVTDGRVFPIGTYFKAEAIPMTHSVPDTRHYLIKTPAGNIYHGSDFKLDLEPIDGVRPDFTRISQLASEGIHCMLIDCLRVERQGWTHSESSTGPVLESAMHTTEGKFIVTLMSSHIHRIQQTVDAAVKNKRKVVFIGRSVEQNVQVALELDKMQIPEGVQVDKRDVNNFKDNQLCIIIAGSQGQEGSSLVRAVYGDHPMLQIKQRDKVVFSADAIPGNEVPYFAAIDELARNGVEVIYPDVVPALHESGHASAGEQQMLVALGKPEYVMPIGGADRHREKFYELVASKMGYTANQVLIPGHGDVVGFGQKHPRVVENITLTPRIVDGLGIGDVGPVVLSDRRALSQAGIIVLVLPRTDGKFDLTNITIVSRGFVFMKEADEVIEFIKSEAATTIKELGMDAKDEEIRRTIEKRLSRKLYKTIKREPMIVSVILEQ